MTDTAWSGRWPGRPLWCWNATGRCIHLEVAGDGEFYEDDEPIERIRQVRARPPDFITTATREEPRWHP